MLHYVDLIKKVFLPQHHARVILERFIYNKKNTSMIKIVYYTYLRDKYAIKYGVEIGIEAEIGKGIYFPHPRNIVIGEKVIIGKNCTIFHDVTIGQKKDKYPQIGDNVIIYTGAKIFGDLRIGNNAIIAAGAVVLKDVPANAVVAGNPANIIKYLD